MVTADELVIKIMADTAAAEKAIAGFARGTESKLSQMAGKLSGVGKNLTAKMTVPILGAGAAAFKMASDLDESMSQAGQVFGTEAANIIKASDSMNDALGQAEFLGFAGNIGDIAQGLGIAQSESDDLALSVLGLSQDLSSFKNVPVEQAVGAITSALTGEREALKTLGIVIKDTDVKQKALAMGLWDGTGALDSAAQAQATYALITEKSQNAIGDFERTSGGAANQVRILSANLKDQAAAIGTQLLPIGTQLLGWVGKAIEWFGNLSPGVKKVITLVAGVAAAIGPVLVVGAKLITLAQNMGQAVKALGLAIKWMTTSALGPWMLAIAAAIAIGVLIWKNWDTIKEKLLAIFKKIKDVFKNVVDAIKRAWNRTWEAIKEVVEVIVAAIKWYITTHIKAIKKVITTTINTIKEVWNRVWGTIKTVAKNTWEAISGAVTGAIDTVKTVIGGAIDWVTEQWGTFTGFLSDAWNTVWDGLSDGVNGAFDAVVAAIKYVLNGLLGALESGINLALKALQKAVDAADVLAGPFINFPDSMFSPVAIPRLAEGGMTLHSGPIKVGERGPEIMNVPAGTAVQPLTGGTVNGDLHVHAHGLADAKAIAQEVGWQFLKRGMGGGGGSGGQRPT